LAIKVMGQKQIDLTSHHPKGVELFLADPWDQVITVCDGAKEVCPHFTGLTKTRLHLGFEDPALLPGTLEERIRGFEQIRDQIETTFWNWSQRL